jgi:hypothetical protein
MPIVSGKRLAWQGYDGALVPRLGCRVILRWQFQTYLNAFRVLITDRPTETITVSGGAVLLIIYYAAGLYVTLVDNAPVIRAHWPYVAGAVLGVAVTAGSWLGYSLGRRAMCRARAPWITVLPWPDSAKHRSARSASLTLGAALTPIAILYGAAITFAVAKPFAVVSGLLTGLCFFLPSASASMVATRKTHDKFEDANITPVSTRDSWVTRLAIVIDRAVPKWVGVWAEAANSRFVPLWWMGSLAIGGGTAGTFSISQWKPWPSVVVAIAGGNLAFAISLNGQPLLSPVLRSSPVGYASVWRALIRLPAILSLAWFAIAALPAIIVSAHLGGECAGAVPPLIFLDALFCAAVALNLSSRRRAMLLYVCLLGVIIYQGLQYGIAYGGLAIVIMLARLIQRGAGIRWRA